MTDLSILGSKGESKPHTPVETPDSLINLSYANILDGISEGPIVGLVNGAQSIYLDRTPLANSDGSMNFTGVTWEQRTGEHDQDHIAGFPAVESQHSVGVELKFSQPWVQAFSNLELSAVRIQLAVGALVVTEQDGDRVGYKVAYEIDLSTDDSDYQVVQQGAFDGKTTTGYQRSIRIDLPKAERGWRLRVRRTTPDSTTSNIQATTSVGTYTEIIDAKLQYPYTALCGLKIDASQFSAVPERAYRIRGRIIQVPSNYDPAGRTYSGTWDGTFKLAWTDCPPWIWRDIVLNDRYGLGRFIDANQVDKWGLYQIAQYCDALVSDGKGGQEPRFTCNVYLQSRADALTVLQDLASVFRGMSYYAGSEVACAADMPGDPVYTYTNANVIDGKFNRPGSSGSTRFSVAKVAWSDRDNFGNQRVEYVQDQKSLVRYGVRETEVTAFGCVSQGQAQRAGQYILLTNRLETGTITFSVGLDGTICRPGDVVRVADEHYAGMPLAGRIKAATATTATLDNDITATAGDTLVVILPKGVAETRVIRSISGRVVTVTEPFSAVPVKESVYTIETAELVAETYRVLTVNENFGDDKLQYDIVAVARDDSKFDAIDNGAQIVIPPTSVLPAAVQAPPTNVELSTFDTLNQGINVATMRITWDAPRGAQSYRVWWKRNNGDWIYTGVTYTAALEVRGIYTGTYTARVAAVGVSGNSSIWALSEPTTLSGKTGEPPAITSLSTESLLFGIKITWGFPAGAEDTQRTELWYSEGTDLEAATKLADLAYPQQDYVMQGLRGGQRFFFWARLVDRTGNLGPFYPVAPTVISGIASMDAGPILDQIKDQITESELGKELTDRIDLIDMDGPGSVNERIGEVRSDLNEQISDVNNHVNEVQNELQHQIDTIADLSDSMPYKPDQAYTAGQSVLGEDGRLYQAKVDVPAGNSPPNATYWVDIGQAVQTANGMAARVQTVETKVQNLEGTSSAQAQQITGLQSSLTTTNGNVAAAQQAAQDAATLAGGKGKVIVQSAAPAAADRLAQNLWIDTTGNANTPKRWNGSAWVAVTDKVATDAAAAAANALAVAQTKADASVVQSLTTRVTDAEGALSSQGQAMTGLQNSLTTTNQNVTAAQQAAQAAADAAGTKGKVLYQSTAPAVADRLTQNLWIDTTSNANTPKRWNGSAWVAVTDKVATDAAAAAANALNQVATKADASTVQALSNTVDQQGALITANGQAITNINTSLTQVGGENLLYNPSFDKEGGTWKVDGWVFGVAGAASGTTGVVSSVVSTLDPTGRAMRFDVTGVNLSGNYVQAYVANRPGLSEGRQIAASVHFRGSTALRLHLYVEFWSATAVLLRTPVVAMDATEAWQRPSVVATAPTGTVSVQILIRTVSPVAGGGAGYLEVDRAQIEQGSVVTGWRDNGLVNATESAANASATSALTGRVAVTETGLSSASSKLTQLENSIGDMGGENLFYNPSFTKLGTSTGNNPDGWIPEGTATYTTSMVTSWLNAAEKAYRCNTTGVGSTASGNPYTSLVTAIERAPAVAPGQTITSSIYVRKTSDSGELGMRIFHQWFNAAGTVINAPATAVVPMTVGGDRISFTSVAPTGAVKVRVFYRAHAAVGGTVAGTFELARPQVEYGSRSTGWRDNGQVNSNAISAVSTAVDGLTSSVSQQGKDITSVSSRTTSLENSVNNGSTGLASKASTAALTSVANRVAATESGLTAQSSSITNLEAKIGTALPFVAGQTWEFINSVEGWKATTSGATITAGPQYATVAKVTNIQVTSTFPVIDGAENPLVRIRLRRRNTGRTSAAMYWANEDGGLAEARRFNWTINTSSGDWQDIEFDLSGNAGWNGKKIWAIRLDMYNSGDANGEVDIAYIAAGRRSVAASGKAFDSLSVNVTQQSDKLAAETQRINGLQSSVGDANAAIQNEASTRASADAAMGKRVDGVQSSLGSTNAAVQQISTAQANLDGKVNATWSVKLGLTSGGSYYAAGFGLGLENQGGTFQSSFVVLANRFAVMNPVGEGLISPFAIQNGQVFISDALISNLSVQKAIVGNSINSSELANDGTPIMRMDFASGTMILLNKAATAYTVYNRRGIDMVINGVRRIRMGEWD
ncbi:phage tail protein [Pseudomonas sp. KCJK9000]|uniref:phage tail protein n=1 Tax=Pseudomonas sp. KCJK9000 TaxID=3344566 RepID=UPI00390608D9